MGYVASSIKQYVSLIDSLVHDSVLNEHKITQRLDGAVKVDAGGKGDCS
jgi:hypothetical protein